MSIIHFYIDKELSIKQLQAQFSYVFPFLRINFFKTEPDNNIFSSRNVMYSPEVRMHLINKNISPGMLEIADSMTVSELEGKLFEQFGLSAQVYRKSGN